MARIRTIKPEFWTDDEVVQLMPYARLLFIGMWNFADDEGYLWDKPTTIRRQILPEDDVNAKALIDQLVGVGLVDRYETSDGKRALHIRSFTLHQKVSHPTPSKIAPQISGVIASAPEDTGTFAPEGKGIEGNISPLPPAKQGDSKLNPRALGTNPRAVAVRERKARVAARADAIAGCSHCDDRGLYEIEDDLGAIAMAHCDHREPA